LTDILELLRNVKLEIWSIFETNLNLESVSITFFFFIRSVHKYGFPLTLSLFSYSPKAKTNALKLKVLDLLENGFREIQKKEF
jgi:hypothetical protein